MAGAVMLAALAWLLTSAGEPPAWSPSKARSEVESSKGVDEHRKANKAPVSPISSELATRDEGDEVKMPERIEQHKEGKPAQSDGPARQKAMVPSALASARRAGRSEQAAAPTAQKSNVGVSRPKRTATESLNPEMLQEQKETDRPSWFGLRE